MAYANHELAARLRHVAAVVEGFEGAIDDPRPLTLCIPESSGTLHQRVRAVIAVNEALGADVEYELDPNGWFGPATTRGLLAYCWTDAGEDAAVQPSRTRLAQMLIAEAVAP